MGSVEGLYGKDHFHLATNNSTATLRDFHFLAVEEIHKLGVSKVGVNERDYRTTSMTASLVYLFEKAIQTIRVVNLS